jgi:hypothetical protein
LLFSGGSSPQEQEPIGLVHPEGPSKIAICHESLTTPDVLNVVFLYSHKAIKLKGILILKYDLVREALNHYIRISEPSTETITLTPLSACKSEAFGEPGDKTGYKV